MKKQILDPWGSLEVSDYEKVFKQFGLSKIHSKLHLDHYLFRRNIIIAHREFEKVFKRIKSKSAFINMTGIASSGPLHLGHKLDIDLFVLFSKFTKKNYFAIADIDAYVSRPKINTLRMAKDIAVNNIAHALALGIPKNSVYLQSKKDSSYYTFTLSLSKKITENMFRAVYGHLDVGKMAANLLQYADIIHPQLEKGKMPSITCIGVDQDPHAKLTRDLARRIDENVELPSFIYFKHQSGLQQGKKMSASEPDTAILLDDKIPEVKRKIAKTFTGGRDTEAEQRKKGGNPDICKIYEIQLFHNPDDKTVQDIYSKCRKGKLMCGDCKKLCLKFLSNFLKKHQKKLNSTAKIAKKIVYSSV